MSRFAVEPWARAVDVLEYELATQEDWREAELDAALSAPVDPDECDCGMCHLCDTSDPGGAHVVTAAGSIPYLDLLVERYGPEARVVEVIEAERALRTAWKERAKAQETKGS